MHVSVFLVDANLQCASTPDFQHRIYGIINDVQEYLFELMRISSDGGYLGFDLPLQLDIVHL